MLAQLHSRIEKISNRPCRDRLSDVFARALMSAGAEPDDGRLGSIEPKSFRLDVQGVVPTGRTEHYENRLSRLYQRAAHTHGRGSKTPGILYRGVIATDFPNESIDLGRSAA